MKTEWKINLSGFNAFGFDMIMNPQTVYNTDQHHCNKLNLQYVNKKLL